ncbi:MAG: DNA polymerase III subunit delta' [Campylobacterota bacterium]|nr:DNA polymerase III subunit delta' [Campylobacterota bacterium]
MKSQILIVNDIQQTLQELIPTLPKHQIRVIQNEQKDEFQLAQAHLALKEAYIATAQTKYIILCAGNFRNEAQNSLLKLLEEPPKNIVFIIITTSKSTLLPTILSRMPYKYLKQQKHVTPCVLDFKTLDLKQSYLFLKEHQKITKSELKAMIESILYKINEQHIKLNTKELHIFSQAMKLNELNSRPINILSTLLLTLVQSKNRS